MTQDNFSLNLSLYLIDIEMVNKYFIGSQISERKFRQIVRFSKFRGINKSTFYLHLKECEFRYNNKEKDIYKLLIYNFRIFPLKLS